MHKASFTLTSLIGFELTNDKVYRIKHVRLELRIAIVIDDFAFVFGDSTSN